MEKKEHKDSVFQTHKSKTEEEWDRLFQTLVHEAFQDILPSDVKRAFPPIRPRKRYTMKHKL